MEFNSYIWQLYKESQEGKTAIGNFSNLFFNFMQGKYIPTVGEQTFDPKGESWAISQDIIDACVDVKLEDTSEAGNLFKEIVSDLLLDENGEQDPSFHSGDLLNFLPEISLGLYTRFPDYFFPYFFDSQFFLLTQLCELFNIPLPELPPKRDFDRRLHYYFELCQVFCEFRRSQKLPPEEFCSFLYSFAMNFVVGELENELPKPINVWISGGGVQNGDAEWLDNLSSDSIFYWQGNIDTKRGDIILVYCLSPRSYIHSVWRAKADGYVDPFFYFYSSIKIGNPVKTVPVTFEDLRNHPVLSQNGLVKAHMQGINGRRFTFKEYEAILEIMQSKGQDISILPRLEPLLSVDAYDGIQQEQDVELKLIEPLLKTLGYTSEDWTRQMVVRMGSGEKVYPDYAFFTKQGKGEEQARMIVEAKYRIRSQKELFKAYWQAKSYALRLQSKVFVIAAIEGIWIYPYDKGFDLTNCIHKTCGDLYNPDIFPMVLEMIGKNQMKRMKIG